MQNLFEAIGWITLTVWCICDLLGLRRKGGEKGGVDERDAERSVGIDPFLQQERLGLDGCAVLYLVPKIVWGWIPHRPET